MYRLRRYRIGIPISNVAVHAALAVEYRRIHVTSGSKAKLRRIPAGMLSAA